jgi:putative membrane protein
MDTQSYSSRIRDHLANERTFLAWMRTTVSLMGFGVVIARLRYLLVALPPGAVANDGTPGRSTLLGLIFVAAGLGTLVFATLSYYRTQRAIENADFRPLGRTAAVFAAVLFVLGILSLVYLLALSHTV